MSVKRIDHIAKTLAKLALKIRRKKTEEASAKRPEEFGGILPFSGKRIAVLFDGGRILTRIPKALPGKRLTKKEQRCFDTEWREPKLYVIYEFDAKGKLVKGSRRYCDGTIGSADDIVRLLVTELKINGAHLASEVVFLGDGAEWIWNRISAICEAAGISPEKGTRILDYYHAAEHLALFAEAGWNKAELVRDNYSELKNLLGNDPSELLVKLRNKSRNGGEILKREYKYFKKNSDAIDYAAAKAKNIPIGSGAVESAIRRVVNLRLKSAGMFWRVENAEGFLHLRCQLKSGNWDRFYLGLMETYAATA